ncbi:bifunctional adenosylcobinamide kinase/adenosylcobinamide-phosphate guanylyltransferase [Streptomyces radicis]|uniref:Adenosylcobinamide kinase n=1 Tax=Streptomyces radicis TaxID=1750517 RepID=A0A3A9WHB2_9ACTN|nr:bifunctional adenosylcobinamide kinase/adenosylcobinamide-phosphate guanylyltransferase [Streptomyces radicis]RKN12210.1 adenosylcobinamide kinase/adenosylcobinamide phosphate guanyltransferase [Streptomyces radicis]RKN25738.1 adenosylcobinamide kinase/adenosylcobinamide phosphate guanyltransferase [Streptomyces radicis]
MDVTLLGTGAPAGLPRPGCPCAACARALGDEVRTATALMVDGALLLDLTPGLALAAARARESLHGVRQVLLSHPHDGPAVALPPELPAPVRLPEGRELTLLSGHRVLAVAVDAPGTGYAVTGPDGATLLYLPPGAAPAGGPVAGGPFDVCLLDVAGRPDALALLRATGAASLTTDVVAVHLDHGVQPGAEARRRLAAAGARALPDGATLTAGEVRHVPDVPRRTLVLGGARSGKSAEAERRLAAFPDVVYAATGGPRAGDAEWAERVAAHRGRRPPGWRTVETCDLEPLLAEDEGPPLLIDCLALWLTDAMDRVAAWDDAAWRGGGARALAERTGALAAAFRATRRTVVAVSNEAGSGVVPATASGRRFRDELGRLNAAVAAECEHVLLAVAGTVSTLR